MPQAKTIIVARRHQPEVVDVKLGGLVVVVEDDGICNVLVSRGTFTRRDTALRYASIIEKQLSRQAVDGEG